MRASIARERKTAKALDFLKSLGIKTEDISTTSAVMVDNSPDNKMLQGEAALLFLQKPERFITKKCDWKECGEYFGTSYKSVAYCSNACRGKATEAITGVKIDWSKPAHERWGGDPPLIIDPETLKNLAAMMQEHRLGTCRGQSQDQPSEQPSPVPENTQAEEAVQNSEPEYPETPANPQPEPDLDTLLAEFLG